MSDPRATVTAGQHPGAYLRGLTGPECCVAGKHADWLFRFADLERLRREHAGEDREIDAFLIALRFVAAEFRASQSASPPSANFRLGGRTLDVAPEVPSSSAAMSTTAVAKALGISSRGVRGAIAEKRLSAQLVAGRWRITAEDLEKFRAGRAA